MALRADVNPELIVWARERSGITAQDLLGRFPKLPEWESGDRAPTLKQLDSFARATHAPIGYLFLETPPIERVPIPDFRTMGDGRRKRPSPDLLDTIFDCQQRQEWYRTYAELNREDPVGFVGTLTAATPVGEAAAAMRETLGFGIGDRGTTFAEAFRRLVETAEDAGVLVMVSGVVGANTRRKLDPEEFRGFALADPLAPLVFVNGADTRAAQIFTLAHELAHLWLGQTALSDADMAESPLPSIEAERWCNEVAAEFLVPEGEVRGTFAMEEPLTEELDRLARLFKVSTLVVLRRVHDAGYLSRDAYRAAYREELARVLSLAEARGTTGGDFYNTQPVRVGKRFARAVIVSTLEGQTLYTEAFGLLGVKKQSTVEELGHRLGVA